MKVLPQLIVGGNCSMEKSHDLLVLGITAHWCPERKVIGLFETTFVPDNVDSLSNKRVSNMFS